MMSNYIADVGTKQGFDCILFIFESIVPFINAIGGGRVVVSGVAYTYYIIIVLLPLMNSFHKTEAAISSFRL